MSRTTALKRLGVAALASVTVFGVAPAFTAPAAANHTVTGVSLSPDADSAPTGTCNQFTATVTLSNGADTATVDVLADPRTTEDVEFCVLSADGKTSTAPAFGDPGASENAEFVADTPAGSTTKTVTFGIISNQPGVIDVTAFVEGATGSTGTNNNAADGNEPRDTSVKTFTAGGAEAVAAVDAEPETGSAVQGGTYTFTAKVTNAGGEPVPGVTPVADVISGPDAALTPTCGATDQTGTATCTLTGGGTTPGTDTIRVFVNKSDPDGNPATLDATAGYNTGEPFDDITVTYGAPQAAGTTVTLTCAGTRTTTAGDNCQNQLTETTEVFTALVKNAAGTALSGVPVSFTLTSTGAGDNDGTASAPAQETISPVTCTTGADGTCTTTLTNPKPATGETFTVQAKVQVSSGAGTGCTPADANATCDSATAVWGNPTANQARNIDLTPATQNAGVPGVATINATVTDRLGNPVAGVQVTFTESGTGRFVNSSGSFVAFTNASGVATAELQTVAGDAAGANTVTGTITGYDANNDGDVADAGDTTRGAGTTDDECEQPVGTTQNAGGNAPGQVAGNCADTATVNFGAASPSPSGSASPTTPANCAVVPTVTLEFGTINATGSSGVTVNAPANSQIELLAYSQPSTTYRVVRRATIDNNGAPAQFRITPPTNTRLYAQIVGCTTNPTTASKVLNVRTTLSLNVTRTGTRAYRFFGDSLPARPGGLIVSLYRVTDSGSQILTAQTRANSQNGDWVINRVFTGTGRFGFVVRTGQDLQNAPGASNVRSLLIF
jgi:hypothetical protein